MQEIAERAGITRVAVWKRLKAAGIETRTAILTRYCAYCGAELQLQRCKVRASRRHYCNTDCYHAVRKARNYVESRQGQRTARQIVSEHFDLQPEHIVHHHDSNNLNNDVKNLAVFASQSDHMKHHHGNAVTPLWDGREI